MIIAFILLKAEEPHFIIVNICVYNMLPVAHTCI